MSFYHAKLFNGSPKPAGKVLDLVAYWWSCFSVLHQHTFPNTCTQKSSISNNMDYSLTITQEFSFHTFPSHTLAHSPANLNDHLLFLCLSRCCHSSNDRVISIHWPEGFPYQSYREGIFPFLWSHVAFHSCIKQTANYLQSNNRMKGGMVDLKISYILLELKELKMWDDNINGNYN